MKVDERSVPIHSSWTDHQGSNKLIFDYSSMSDKSCMIYLAKNNKK